MTTTDLVTFNNQDNFASIAALTGASVSSAVYLPRLRVNRHAVNDDDKSIPMGTYAVTQDDSTVYSKTVLFRIFINAFQYSEYDPKERKYVNRSVIIKGFNEEPIDELGGIACGKVSAKNLDSLSAEQKAHQKNIKCTRLLYGTVCMEETIDADGNKDSIVNLPVVFRLNGGNFMAPKDALAAITKMKHHFFQHYLKLTTKRNKQGDNIFYDIVVNPTLDTTVPFTEEDLETFNLFQEVIERENSYISKKWTEAKRSLVKASDDDIDVASALGFDDSLPRFEV
jgi:hypothetical protein